MRTMAIDVTQDLTKAEWHYIMHCERTSSSLFCLCKHKLEFFQHKTKYKDYWVYSNLKHDGLEEGMYRLALRAAKCKLLCHRFKFFSIKENISVLTARCDNGAGPYNYETGCVFSLSANLVSDHDWLSLIAGAPD